MEPVYSKWWLPIQASNYAADVDSIILVIHVFMAALFVGWGIFFIYCLFRFRERPGHRAQYSDVSGGISKAVEIGVVIFEVVLLVGFSMPVWARVKNEFPTAAESTVCRIVAKRFEWLVHYPGADGKFGRTDAK